jgi:hypothetical protein
MVACRCPSTSSCVRRIVCSVAVESSKSSPGAECDAGSYSASPGITGIGGNGMSGSSDAIMDMITITGGKQRRGGTATGGTGDTGETHKNAFALLPMAFNIAVTDGLIPKNPCAGVELPRP